MKYKHREKQWKNEGNTSNIWAKTEQIKKWLTLSQILRSLGKSILIEGKKAESKGERKTERL